MSVTVHPCVPHYVDELIQMSISGKECMYEMLPVLPTTPFLLLASFCLAKGSERFHRWFTGTKLYKKHLEGFVKNRSMTLKTKFSLLIPASCMLLLAFLAMQNVYGRAFIVFLIVFKYVYFFTKIRTVPAGGSILPETEG